MDDDARNVLQLIGIAQQLAFLQPTGMDEEMRFDPGIRQIALRAGLEAQPEMELPRDAVEDLYQRVASQAMAGTAASGIEGDAGFIATVVILRESMQHLGFDRIAILSDAAY